MVDATRTDGQPSIQPGWPIKLLAAAGDAGRALSGRPANPGRHLFLRRFPRRHEGGALRRPDGQAASKSRRESCVPANKVVAFFSNPFADLAAARTRPAEDRKRPDHARAQRAQRLADRLLHLRLMAFFAVGPGVCVWLALSELMPTRIRSNGMSIALLINQAVSTTIAAVFLPTVGKYGYSTMFFAFAGCTVIYFITAAFFLPETKGKTLEEIEEHFSGVKKA